MNQPNGCAVCAQPTPTIRHTYCSSKCKWTAANRNRYKRPPRSCPGCGTDLSGEHGKKKYCSNACRRWHASGHDSLRVLPTRCDQCGGAMVGKHAGARFCTRTCKTRASEQRRVRDDAARYQLERDRRIAYALAYAKRNPHIGQASKNRRKAWQRNAGVFLVTGKDWLRICNRHGNVCYYCHRARPLTMDHIVPLSRGGRHSIGNLVPACASCNASKSNRYLTEWRVARAAA